MPLPVIISYPWNPIGESSISLCVWHLSVIKARFSCILVNLQCRFEDTPSVPERSYEQSVDTVMHL